MLHIHFFKIKELNGFEYSECRCGLRRTEFTIDTTIGGEAKLGFVWGGWNYPSDKEFDAIACIYVKEKREEERQRQEYIKKRVEIIEKLSRERKYGGC